MVNKIMEEQIMSHKFHEFLYGYNTEERTNFLKKMEKHYPITYGEDVPMGIYLEPYGISTCERDKELVDKDKSLMLGIASREYLKNLIAYNIVSHIEKNSIVMGQIENEMIDFLNGYQFDRKEKVISVQNYLKELRETLNICQENYNSILLNGSAHPQMYDFPSDFYDIEWFGKDLKKILNNNGQFNIIVDYRNPIVLESANAIMSIVNSRCAGTICMKIATDMEKWPTYTDLNGRFVEHIHDYSIVELDDSYRKTLDKRIARFRNK